MAKNQVNVRVSDYTRERLDVLTVRHGTQTEVVAIAIERLYAAEAADGVGLYEMAQDRVYKSAVLSAYEDFIFADWAEGDDHWRWLIMAPEGEIVSWAIAGQE